MELTTKPRTSLSKVFSNWLRPESMFNGDLFDFSPDIFPSRIGMNIPSVNIKETTKEYTLELAVPGLERKDFNIEVENNILTISVEKEQEYEEGNKSSDYWKKEYSYDSFSRSFTLPENVKEGNIDAKYKEGILTVHVPKSKETPVKSAHKITVS